MSKDSKVMISAKAEKEIEKAFPESNVEITMDDFKSRIKSLIKSGKIHSNKHKVIIAKDDDENTRGCCNLYDSLKELLPNIFNTDNKTEDAENFKEFKLLSIRERQ